ncbi:hypothetical protein Tco_1486665, partial [Tanacetum coccineum]
LDDPYVAVRQAQLVDTDTESEPEEAPSDAKESQPLVLEYLLLMRTRVAKAMNLLDSAFRKRYRSSYETPSPSPFLTLPVRKRYRGTSELILNTDSERGELGDEDTTEDREDKSSDMNDKRERSEDEGPGLEEREDEVVPEGQQQAVLAANTTVGEPLGLGYEALRHRELAVGED